MLTPAELLVVRCLATWNPECPGHAGYVGTDDLLERCGVDRDAVVAALIRFERRSLVQTVPGGGAPGGFAAVKLTERGREELVAAGVDVPTARRDAAAARDVIAGARRVLEVGEVAQAMGWDIDRAWHAVNHLCERRVARWERLPAVSAQHQVVLVE